MKAMITGGAGFIGSNIVKVLVEEGHDVVVLDNLMSGFKCNLESYTDAEFIEGDIRDEETVERAIRGCDVVFHLAASVGNKRSIDHPIMDAQINVIGTLNILEAAKREGIRKIVTSSSAGIFGELKTLPIDEGHPLEPDSPYGCTKLCQEKLSLAYAKLNDIESICLRYFNVYGPNQRFDAYGNVIPIFVFQMLKGENLTIFGDGEQTRDFICVRDVARANVDAAMTTGVSGAFNVASGTRITINRLVEMLRETSGIEPALTYGAPRQGDVRHSLADITAAREAFGYEPKVALAEGLAEYVQWAKEELVREQCAS